MATNEFEDEEPVEQTGPVAQLVRIVHAAARPNDQTPLRVLALVVSAVAMSTAPSPANVIGTVALIILTLSLGQPTRRVSP